MKRGIRQHGKAIALLHDHGRYQTKLNDLWARTLNISNARDLKHAGPGPAEPPGIGASRRLWHRNRK
jgi:hypothetical protein